MTPCATCRISLRNAIAVRGLGDLVSKSAAEASARVAAGGFDPMLFPVIGANSLLLGLHRQDIIGRERGGEDVCCFCELATRNQTDRAAVINSAADAALEEATRLGLIKPS